MADDEKTEASEETAEEEQAPKSKKGIVMGGGIVGLIAAAYIVSMVALPGASKPPPFDGPFITELSAGEVQVNLKGAEGRRYLVMSLKAEYEGYDEAYVAGRVVDPVYMAKLDHALISIGRQKTMEDVSDSVGEETFVEEVRVAVDPLLFPVHVGNPSSFLQGDGTSGLGPGRSAERSTMRGGYKAHAVHIDALKGTIALDDGPVVDFDHTEQDLMLSDASGLNVYVDTTEVDVEFVGDVNVGTFGRVRAIHFNKFITQ